jgi:hypothetical protein
MFDRLAWRREFYERYLLGLDDEEEPDDHETPVGDLARMADDVEADWAPPSRPRP